MGDDLAAAREFVDHCVDKISELIAGDLAEEHAVKALETMDGQARAMNARAISRIIRLVRDDFRFSLSAPQRKGNLLALNKLILQYESGLVEIENALRDAHDAQDGNDQIRFDRAATTLKSVMKYARQGSEQNAFWRLISLADPQANTSENRIELDAIMPKITDHVLRTARQQGKSVSLSLSAEGVEVTQTRLDQIEEALGVIGEAIVTQAVEAPEIRRQRGLSQSAHIAMTAYPEGEAFHMLISADGPGFDRQAFEDKSVSALVEAGMKTGIDTKQGKVNIALGDIPLSAEPPMVFFQQTKPVLREMHA